jgi:hypothetical protein
MTDPEKKTMTDWQNSPHFQNKERTFFMQMQGNQQHLYPKLTSS